MFILEDSRRSMVACGLLYVVEQRGQLRRTNLLRNQFKKVKIPSVLLGEVELPT